MMMKHRLLRACARRRLVLFLLLSCAAGIAPLSGAGGRWNLLQRSIDVSAMHMQLLRNDRVVIFDRTDFGRSNLALPPQRPLPPQPAGPRAPSGLHRALRRVRRRHQRVSPALRLHRHLVLVGHRRARRHPCPDRRLGRRVPQRAHHARVRRRHGGQKLRLVRDAGRAHREPVLRHQPDPPRRPSVYRRGRRQYNYEFYPKADPSDHAAVVQMPFLVQTRDPEENNLYPFVYLNIDGNLFVFANNRAILFDYKRNRVVRMYPELSDGDPRNYPSSGSSVLLPLKPNPTEAEVLACGGARVGSYNSTKGNDRTFVPALVTCGRIKITDASTSWVLETMLSPRVMGDMILLPNGAEVAIINGATDGTAGWDSAKTPAYTPVVYRPGQAPGDRFEEQSPSGISRLYHSSSVLLPDGRLLVGGSNPHIYYNFSNLEFPTELSLEAFSTEYLDPSNDVLRPRILEPSPTGAAPNVTYGETMMPQFAVPAASRRRRSGGSGDGLGAVSVTMVAPSFTTHSFAMNQRLLFLEATKPAAPARPHRRLRGVRDDAGDRCPGAAGVLHGVRRERAHPQRGDLGPHTVTETVL